MNFSFLVMFAAMIASGSNCFAQNTDLVVTSASVVGTNIVATIQNNGTSYNGSARFNVHFNNQSSGIGYSTSTNLVPPSGFGGTIQVTAPIANTGLQGCSGSKNFIITVNPTRNVPESNYFNNSYSIALPCQPLPPPPPPPATSCAISSFSGPDSTTSASHFEVIPSISSSGCTKASIMLVNSNAGSGMGSNYTSGPIYGRMNNLPYNWTDNSLSYYVLVWNSANQTMDARGKNATVTDISPSPVQCILNSASAIRNGGATNPTIDIAWSAPAQCSVQIKYHIFSGDLAWAVSYAPGGSPIFPSSGVAYMPAPNHDTVIEISTGYASSPTAGDYVSDVRVITVRK